MTDNEIIKALECCTQQAGCSGCPFVISNEMKYRGGYACSETLRKNALDLINRQKEKIKEFDEKLVIQQGLIDYQKAKIERLNMDNKEINILINMQEKNIREQQVIIDTLRILNKSAKSEAIEEFASKVNPIIEQLIEIMFDGNQNKCMIKNCHKHSSVPCESPTCIDENKAFWKLKIYDIVKEMTEVETNQRKEDEKK